MKTAALEQERKKISNAYRLLLKGLIESVNDTLQTLTLMEGASSTTLLTFKNIQLPTGEALLTDIPLRMEPLLIELQKINTFDTDVSEKIAIIRELILRAKSYITQSAKYLQKLNESADFRKTIEFKKKLELKQKISLPEYEKARKGWIKLHYTAGTTLAKARDDLKRARDLSEKINMYL